MPASLRIVVVGLVLPAFLYGCGGRGPTSPVTQGIRSLESSSTRSVLLNNYNNWGGPRSEDEMQTLVKHDRICLTEHYGDLQPAMLRGGLPNVKVYRVYDLCCKNVWDSDWNDPNDTSRLQTPIARAVIDANDWWLRDCDGNIVRENDVTLFLDVGKPGFKEEYLRNVLDRLAGKGFDGVVFDYWYSNVPYIVKSSMMPQSYPTDADWFEKAWKPFIGYVIAGLRNAGYAVVGNCAGEYQNGNSYQVWQRNQLDGVVYEQWAVGWDGEWLQYDVIKKRIAAFSSDPLEVWTADFGLRTSSPDYQNKADVALALYYIALPSSASLRSNRFYHHYADTRLFWEPLWDLDIGEPAGDYFEPGGHPGFFVRRFTKGIVLLNYSSAEGVTYSLGGSYRTLSQETVSGDVAVRPYTAMILAADNSRRVALER